MIHFDPNPIAFTMPILQHPVTWYGICFAVGLLLSLEYAKFLLRQRLNVHPEHPSYLAINQFSDRIFLWVIFGLLIGARLFEIFFYSPHIWQNGWEIIQIWQGGLSSHGGILGVIIAVYLFFKIHQKELSALGLRFSIIADAVATASGICACMIRIGNFINQEIVGTPSELPWAVVFGHPAGGLKAVARHPVQVYEALAYLTICVYASKRMRRVKLPGIVFCETLLAIFAARFVLEYFKAPLLLSDYDRWLSMGQILSIPALIFLAGWRIFYSFSTPKN